MDNHDIEKALGRKRLSVRAGLWAHRWFALAVVAVILAILMGRYSLAGGERAVHRLDRWTGAVQVCVGGVCR